MSNNQHALQPANYDDLCALPENRVGELIAGTLYSQPRPAPRHALAASRLGSTVLERFDPKGKSDNGWWILDEPECHLKDDIVVPDIAGWRRERMPALPDTAFFTLAPDWVCEVLSPSTAAHDRVLKQSVYAVNGVPYMWFIDPVLHMLEAYELNDHQWTLIAALENDDEVAVAPFTEKPFNLSDLWE